MSKANRSLYEQHLIALLHDLVNINKITKDEAYEIFQRNSIYNEQVIKDTEYIWKKKN